MKKNEWLWKCWKRNDLYENCEKGGVVEKKGEKGYRKNCVYWLQPVVAMRKKLWTVTSNCCCDEIKTVNSDL
jgi:hypothetical protein